MPSFFSCACFFGPGAPLAYFNDGGVRVILFGSDILPSDSFGSMKDAGIFLGHEKKKNRDFFGL